MDRFRRVIILLCFYGFFKELRPSEPFLTPYLKGYKNLTENEVNNQIYPVSTYATLSWLLLVLLFSDLCRQKAVLVIGGFAYVVTWILLIWGKGVLVMQMMQFVYGLTVAAEISYYTYVYLVVSRQHYRRATSVVRVTLLIGRCMSGLLSQVLISLHLMTYLELNYISLSSVSVALILSFILPVPRKAVVTLVLSVDNEERLKEESSSTCLRKNFVAICQEIRCIFRTLKESYSNYALLKWSLWWAFATCGFYQVGNYGQNLWDEISPSRDNPKIFNGAVEALATLLGAALAFMVGFIPVDWNKFGELLLGVVCVGNGVCLFWLGQTNDLFMAYILYLVFRALYQPGITAAYFQVASFLKTERYGLIFGSNTFMALFFETLLTMIVVDKGGLNLPVRTQFLVYGFYFAVIGIIFLVAAMVTCFHHRRTMNQNEDLVESDSQIASHTTNEGARLSD